MPGAFVHERIERQSAFTMQPPRHSGVRGRCGLARIGKRWSLPKEEREPSADVSEPRSGEFVRRPLVRGRTRQPDQREGRLP